MLGLLLICRSFKLIVVFLIGVLYIQFSPKVEMLNHSSFGYGFVKITEVQEKNYHHVYSGKLQGFLDKNAFLYLDESLSFFLPSTEKALKPGVFIIQGSYIPKGKNHVSINKIKSIQHHSSLPLKDQLLFVTREKLKKIEQSTTSFKIGESLLLGCLFGTKVSQDVKLLFSKLGLSHILAISGFHFSLVALLLTRLLKPLFPKRLLAVSLIVLMSLYASSIGSGASIFRAYLMITLALIGTLFERETISTNLLFVVLIILFCIDPKLLNQVGFQLSFLATFGILTFYKPMMALINTLLPQRTYPEALELDHLNQIGYIILQMLKKIIAVNLSALIPTFVVLLYYFKTISSLSFVYNLFVPTVIGIAMTFGLIGIVLKIFLGFNWLYEITCQKLEELISFLNYYPRAYDYPISVSDLNTIAVIVIEALIIFLGLYLKIPKKKTEIKSPVYYRD